MLVGESAVIIAFPMNKMDGDEITAEISHLRVFPRQRAITTLDVL
jgi:hypothetical protein